MSVMKLSLSSIEEDVEEVDQKAATSSERIKVLIYRALATNPF